MQRYTYTYVYMRITRIYITIKQSIAYRILRYLSNISEFNKKKIGESFRLISKILWVNLIPMTTSYIPCTINLVPVLFQ